MLMKMNHPAASYRVSIDHYDLARIRHFAWIPAKKHAGMTTLTDLTTAFTEQVAGNQARRD